MKRFRITLTADAYMAAEVEIDATDAQEAVKKAITKANEGNVSWEYNGVNTETIEAQDETEVLAWIPANIGCYWKAERPGRAYLISTVTIHNGTRIEASAYDLTCTRKQVGRYATLAEAKQAANEYNLLEVHP